VFERASGETAEDKRFFRADIIEHSEYFDLKLFDFVSGEHCAPGAVHPGLEIFEREERRLCGQSGGERERRRYNEASHIFIVLGRCEENWSGSMEEARVTQESGA
jgi:hypothetical protein